MPSDTWDRIEPHTRLDSLEEGLQARIADPLWMLARQWQLGEFRGEDAASPIEVSFGVRRTPLSSYRNDARRRAAAPQGGRPLEVEVEAEQVANGPSELRRSVEAGLQLLRRLDAAGLGALWPTLRAMAPLTVGADAAAGLPERHAGRLALLARRAVDGLALLRAEPSAFDGVPADQRAALEPILAAWRAEVEGRFAGPTSEESWAVERLEYAFSLGARTSEQAEVVLTASEHAGGHLDWYSFDVARNGRPHGIPDAPTRTQARARRLPVPLAYSGMPRSRWWELEDGSVYFGGIEAGPADIGRLVVAEYALVYSDDWFLFPVAVPAGSLVRIVDVEVRDTFGGRHATPAAAVLDERDLSPGEARVWAFFELTGDPSAQEGRAPWLLVAPAGTPVLEGEAIERVSFLRDEAANLAWAVESEIEGPLGQPLRRRMLGAPATPEGEGAPNAWRYRLQQAVPPWWIPFIPERVEPDAAETRLRRARMAAWNEIDTPFSVSQAPPRPFVGARGRILVPERPLRLFEEEVQKGGIEVTRRWRYARGADGRAYLWLARHKRPGRGERGSGLGFDTMERTPPGEVER